MSKQGAGALKSIGWAFYWAVAVLFAGMATAMTYISDGPVDPVVHIMAFVMVFLIFAAIPYTWRLINKGKLSNWPFKRSDHE